MSNVTFNGEEEDQYRSHTNYATMGMGEDAQSGGGMTRLIMKMGIKNEQTANYVLMGIIVGFIVITLCIYGWIILGPTLTPSSSAYPLTPEQASQLSRDSHIQTN